MLARWLIHIPRAQQNCGRRSPHLILHLELVVEVEQPLLVELQVQLLEEQAELEQLLQFQARLQLTQVVAEVEVVQ